MAAHLKGTAHEWNSESARAAGRKGGRAKHRRAAVLVMLLLSMAVPSFAQRVAVAGDSSSDSYRANDNRCRYTPYAATTLNWVELLDRLRGVDFGEIGTFSEPRRRDFSMNWARSGAISADVNTRGQAAGVAAQAPDVAILWVGSNDINPATKQRARDLYNGVLSASTRAGWINLIVNEHLKAIVRMQSTGAQGWMVTIPRMPQPHPSYQNPAGLARIALAVQEMNVKLVQAAPVYGYGLIDIDGSMETWLTARGNLTGGGLMTGGTLRVGGQTMVLGLSCHPTRIILADGHAGTVVNGLIAAYVAEVTGITTPLTDEEIVQAAGL